MNILHQRPQRENLKVLANLMMVLSLGIAVVGPNIGWAVEPDRTLDSRLLRSPILDDDEEELFGFAASIDLTTGALSALRGVPAGSPLAEDPGLLFEPGLNVVIDAVGMRIVGSGRALINHPDILPGELTAVYSEDFLIGGDVLGILAGRVDFQRGFQILAYADVDGFHLSDGVEDSPPADDIIASLPDRLPLPDERLAYLLIRRGLDMLVDGTLNDDGSVTLVGNAGQPELYMPPLGGVLGLEAAVPTLTIDPVTLAVLDGQVHVDQDLSDPIYDFESGWGVPFLLTAIDYTAIEGGLHLGGHFKLMEGTVPQDPLRIFVPSDGLIDTSLSLGALGDEVPLVEGSDRLVLQLRSLDVTLTLPLLTGGLPSYTLLLDATYRIQQDGALAAGADLTLELNPTGLTVASFTSLPDDGTTPLLLDGLALDFNGVDQLDVVFQSDGSQTLRAMLSPYFGSTTMPVAVPLEHVALDPSGFYFPTQAVEQHPPTAGVSLYDIIDPQVPAFRHGPLDLYLLAFRLPETRFDWFAWNPGQDPSIDPALDFEGRLHGFAGNAPRIADAQLTLQNAHLDGGLLVGDVLPYPLTGGEVVPLDQVAFDVTQIGGGLALETDGTQAFNIRFQGDLSDSALFEAVAGASCTGSVDVQLAGNDGFEGTISGYTPCGIVPFSPFELTYTNADLAFAYDGTTQEVVLGGSVSAVFEHQDFTGGTGSGTLGLDLVAGVIQEVDLEMQNFGWTYPRITPLFDFQVDRANVTPEGLVFINSGTVAAGTEDAAVRYNDLQVPFAESAIESGSVEFRDAFAFDVTLPGLGWSVPENAILPGDDAHRVRLMIPSGRRLFANGLDISGEGTASFHTETQTESDLDVAYSNLLLTFQPTKVERGTADLNQGDTRVAWIDQDGFHLESGPVFSGLPDILPLGSEQIAYLRLRDADGNHYVDTEVLDGGRRRIFTRPDEPAPVVFAGLGGAEGTLAYDIIVNEAFGFESDIARTSLADSAVVANSPLQIKALTFLRTGELDLDLVADMDEIVPGLAMPFRARAGAAGFADGELLVGAVTESGKHSTALDAFDPLSIVHFNDAAHDIDSSLTVLTRGGQFDYVAGTYTILGDIASKAFGRMPVSADVTTCAYGEPQTDKYEVKFLSWGLEYGEKETTNTCAQAIHYTASWDAGAWEMNLDVDDAGGTLPIGSKGTFTYDAGDGVQLITGADFALDLKGTLGIPGVSVGINVTVSKMHLGADSLYATATGVDQQQMEVMKQLLVLRPNKDTIRFTVDDQAAFAIRFDGDMLLNTVKAERTSTGDWRYLPTKPDVMGTFLGKDLSGAKFANADYSCANAQKTVSGTQAQSMVFEDLRLDTNGKLEFGQGEYNLLAKYSPISVIEDKLCVHWLGIGMKDSQFTGAQVPFLRLGMVADIPNMKAKGSVSRNDSGIGIGGSRAPATERDGSKVQMTGLVQIGFMDASFAVDLYGVFDSGVRSSVTDTVQAYFRDRAAFESEYDPQINESLGELNLFDQAVLELTGLGLEMDFEKVDFRVRAALALHIYGKDDGKGAVTNTTGSRGISAVRRDAAGRPYKTIKFADPRKLQAGDGLWFRYYRGGYSDYDSTGTTNSGSSDTTSVSTGGFEDDGTFFSVAADGVGKFSFGWNLFAESGGGLFDIDLDLISFTLTRLQINPEDVWFSMDGRATLRLPVVQGSFGYKGFTAGIDTLNFGKPQGPFVLSIDKYVALEVGCFQFDKRSPDGDALSFTRPKETALPSGLIAIEDETITDLETYFLFTSCSSIGTNPAAGVGDRALRLAIFTGIDANSNRWTSATPSDDTGRGPVTIGSQRGDTSSGWESARPSDLEGAEEEPSVLFTGSIRQVVYYMKTNGDIYFDLDRAEVKVGQSDAFEASIVVDMTLQTDSVGFGLDVSGVGKLGLAPKPDGTFEENYAFVAVGKFSTLGGELSMGIFLAASGFTVPIVPGVVDLLGAGGGFFWKPDEDDIGGVYTGLQAMTGGFFRSQNPNGLPRSDNLTFAAMLYAQAGIGGSAGEYAVEAYALLTVTDQFVNLDLMGKVALGDDLKLADSKIGSKFGDPTKRPEETEPKMKFGAYLTVMWQEHIRGVQGGAGLYYVERAEVGDLASATGKIDFYFLSKARDATAAAGTGYWDGDPNTKPTSMEYAFVWAITGHVDVKFFAKPASPLVSPLFMASADLLICERGFLFNIHAEFNMLIADLIKIYAWADVDFWWNDPRQELGVFAGLTAGVTVAGGLASAEIALQIGLLWEASEEDYIFFGAGRANVTIVGVFDGEVAAWFAVTSTGADGGLGENAEYVQRIADSRALMEEMKAEAEAVLAVINDPTTSLGQYIVSEEAAAAAGRALIEEDTAVRQQAVGDMLESEAHQVSTATDLFDKVGHRVFNQKTSGTGTPIVLPGGYAAEATALNEATGRLRDRATALQERFAAIDFALDEAEATAYSLDTITNPAQRTGNDFTINEGAVDAQRSQFTNFRTSVEEHRERFAEVVVALEEKMAAVDSLLIDADNSLASYGEDFADAFEKNGAFLEGKVRARSDSWLWAQAGQQWIATQETAVEDVLHDVNNKLDPRLQEGSPVTVRHDEDAYATSTPPDPPGADDGPIALFDYLNQLNGYHRLALHAANRAAFVTDLEDGSYEGTTVNPAVSCEGAERWLSGNYKLYTAFVGWQNLLDDAVLGCALETSSSAAGVQLQELRRVAYENGKALWYTMPRETLESLKTDMQNQAYQEIGRPYLDTLWNVIRPPWELYTERLEHVYARKSSLTETMAGLYGAYADWAENNPDSTAHPLAERARDEQQVLLEDLRPPRLTGFRIESITVLEANEAFWQQAFSDFNTGTSGSASFPSAVPQWPLAKVDLAWETGGSPLADASIHIDQGSEPYNTYNSFGFGVGGSLGQRKRLSVHVMAIDPAETARELNLHLGVRSRSGAQFKVFPKDLPEIIIPLTHGGGATIAGDDLLPPGDGSGGGGSTPAIWNVRAMARDALGSFWINPSVDYLPLTIEAFDPASVYLNSANAEDLLTYRARFFDTDGNPVTGWQILDGNEHHPDDGHDWHDGWLMDARLNLNPAAGAEGFQVKLQVENTFGQTVETDFYSFWRTDYDILVNTYQDIYPTEAPRLDMGGVLIMQDEVFTQHDYLERSVPLFKNWLKGDPEPQQIGLPITVTAQNFSSLVSDSLVFEYQIAEAYGDYSTSAWYPMGNPVEYRTLGGTVPGSYKARISYSPEQRLMLQGFDDWPLVFFNVRARNAFGQVSSVWQVPKMFGLDLDAPVIESPFAWMPAPAPTVDDVVLAAVNGPVENRPVQTAPVPDTPFPSQLSANLRQTMLAWVWPGPVHPTASSTPPAATPREC